MKTFLLAATVAAGLVCSAGTADAQFRYRRSNVYVAPAYNSYPYSYATPSYYNGGVVSSSYYAPSYYNGGVVTSSYVAPVYPSVGYSSYYNGGYYNSGYYGNSYYGNSYYGGYRGRGWRW